MDTELILREAIETRKIVKIRYHGGSQPGTLREIAPILVKGSKVQARCYASDAVKTFIIEKVEIVDFSDKGDYWQKDRIPITKYENLTQLLNEHQEFLSEFGWNIESCLAGDQQSIKLHRRFKNGKPMKGFDVSVSYEKYAYDLIVDWESDAEELEATPQITGERKRPWSVSAKNDTVRSYSSLDKAAPLFIEWAEKYAPTLK